MASDGYDIETLLQEHGLLSSKPNSVRPQKRRYATLVIEDELVRREDELVQRVFGDADRDADRE